MSQAENCMQCCCKTENPLSGKLPQINVQTALCCLNSAASLLLDLVSARGLLLKWVNLGIIGTGAAL